MSRSAKAFLCAVAIQVAGCLIVLALRGLGAETWLLVPIQSVVFLVSGMAWGKITYQATE